MRNSVLSSFIGGNDWPTATEEKQRVITSYSQRMTIIGDVDGNWG